jgi:hypothetical protein
MNNDLKMRVQEILTANGLDFQIEKIPMVGIQPTVSVDDNGELIKSSKQIHSDMYGLLNTSSGEILKSVKNGYVVSQNDEVVGLVLKGMEKFGSQLSVQKAGSLNGGRRVFIQLAIEGTASVGSDTIKRYVTIIDSNDGSTGLSVGIGDLTMSCSNQFFHFHKSGQSRMRHTANLDARMLEIPTLIESALESSMQMINTYNEFTKVSVSDKNIHDLVLGMTGISKLSSVIDRADASTKSSNAMNKLYETIRTEIAQKGKNVWGLHSGVTRWTTHEKSAPKRDNGRIESAMLSTNYRTNQQSLAFAKELLSA